MRDLPWTAAFDGAYCFGNSFAYVPPVETRKFLHAVARALRPGGRFALDAGTVAECVLPRLREREWAQFDDILFLEENRYDAAEGCIETAYTFVRDGRSETRTGLQWVHTARELRGLLAEAGLETVGLYGGPDGSAFAVGSFRGLFVAERRA
jgi:SAM-dependent methyltransferase